MESLSIENAININKNIGFKKDKWGYILNNGHNIEKIASYLNMGKPFHWNCSLGNGTMFSILFVPRQVVQGDSWPGCNEDFTWVSITGKGSYQFRMGWIAPSYISEKLKVLGGDAMKLSEIFQKLGNFLYDNNIGIK